MESNNPFAYTRIGEQRDHAGGNNNNNNVENNLEASHQSDSASSVTSDLSSLESSPEPANFDSKQPCASDPNVSAIRQPSPMNTGPGKLVYSDNVRINIQGRNVAMTESPSTHPTPDPPTIERSNNLSLASEVDRHKKSCGKRAAVDDSSDEPVRRSKQKHTQRVRHYSPSLIYIPKLTIT